MRWGKITLLRYTDKGFAFQVTVLMGGHRGCKIISCSVPELLNLRTPQMMVEGAGEWHFWDSVVRCKSGMGSSLKL